MALGEKKKEKWAIVLFWVPVEKLALNQVLEWSLAITESYSRLQSHQRKMYWLWELNGISAGNCLIVWKKNSLALGGPLRPHKSLLQRPGEGFICCSQVTLASSHDESPHKHIVTIICQYQWFWDYSDISDVHSPATLLWTLVHPLVSTIMQWTSHDWAAQYIISCRCNDTSEWGGKKDLSDFNHDKFVGARYTGLSVTDLLGFTL